MDLNWSDIKSDTMSIDDYLKIFKEKKEIIKNFPHLKGIFAIS